MEFTPFLRTPYNYDTNAAGDEDAIHCEEETRTQQNFAEECDINTIVRRFGLTGQLPENVRQPQYGDFVGIFDYHGALTAITQANESFARMPADVRARFNNNPEQFVAYCIDPANLAEVRKLGLTTQTEEQYQHEQLAERARANARAEGTERPGEGRAPNNEPQR